MISDIASIATAVGALLAAGGIQLARVQQRRNFEALYVQRFWSVMDDFSAAALTGRPPAAERLSPEDRRTCIRYLMLCEDELDVFARGYISEQTWRIWEEGIRRSLGQWPISVTWAALSTEGSASSRQPFVGLSLLAEGGSVRRAGIVSRRRSAGVRSLAVRGPSR